MNPEQQPTNASEFDARSASAESRPAPQLDWQAWLYISGELDTAAHAAFEALLLEDTAACEAVARAVELADLMTAARPALQDATAIPAPALATAGLAETGLAGDVGVTPAPRSVSSFAASRESNWSQRAGWMALGAAACLAVMLAGRAWQTGGFQDSSARDDDGQFAAASEDDDRTLAVVWTELWNSNDALSPADSDALDDTDALAVADSVLAGATRDERDSDPPDWLLAAVADDATADLAPAAPAPN